MNGLIRPHGGLDVPVSRDVPEGEREGFLARVSDLPRVSVEGFVFFVACTRLRCEAVGLVQ